MSPKQPNAGQKTIGYLRHMATAISPMIVWNEGNDTTPPIADVLPSEARLI